MSFFTMAVLVCIGMSNVMHTKSIEKQIKTSETIADVVQQHPQLSIFWELIQNTPFAQILAGDKSFTLFAPSNSTLEAYQNSELTFLLNPEYELEFLACLQYHLVKFRYPTIKIENYRRIKTTTGEFLNIELNNGNIVINGRATIVQKNIVAKNGIIHIIDNILLPAELETGAPVPAVSSSPVAEELISVDQPLAQDLP